MAVFTSVTPEQVTALLSQMTLGDFRQLQGISSGIENSNYFLTTSSDEYVLTIFERLTFAQVPFYLELMQHLAIKGLEVPRPQADKNGQILLRLAEKPTTIVNKLAGKVVLQPTVAHCHLMGTTLARLHLAAQDFPMRQPNLRALSWQRQTSPKVMPYLTYAQRELLSDELNIQTALSSQKQYLTLPRAAVHCDLFRDNVLFTGSDSQPQLGGVIDFYFAGYDTLLFDLAVCLNDWCINQQTKEEATDHQTAFLTAYTAVRPLSRDEQQLLGLLLRAAALRFWLSRLNDFYLPRQAALLKPHDPTHFEKILVLRRRQYPI